LILGDPAADPRRSFLLGEMSSRREQRNYQCRSEVPYG
jgi:hypothetical protein